MYGRRLRSRCALTQFPTRGRIEFLERRDLLTAAPAVTDVSVASTAWSSAFYDYLEDNSMGTEGYSIPVGSTAQTAPLPWENIDQIKITFSEDVHVDMADLALTGVNSTAYNFSDFFYDAQSYVATWTLSSSLGKDRLFLDLSSNGLDPVEDLDGENLNGEWTDNVSTYNSGNAFPGGDFEFSFNVLPSDADQSQEVDYTDYFLVEAANGAKTTDSSYNALYDGDGSGQITPRDVDALLGRIGFDLPTGTPAGVNNDAPTTSGFSLVEIDDDTIDVAISLYAGFDDLEDADYSMDYSIVSNSNPSLFDSASIDSGSGDLVLNAAYGASGRATLKIKAVDTGGIPVFANVTVDVDRENQAPILAFVAEELYSNTWKFSGSVSDVDDETVGWIIDFTGVIDTRATVDESGEFEFVIHFTEEPFGTEWAQTWDPHGLSSNIPEAFIGLT